jgi:hypothetical protein
MGVWPDWWISVSGALRGPRGVALLKLAARYQDLSIEFSLKSYDFALYTEGRVLLLSNLLWHYLRSCDG